MSIPVLEALRHNRGVTFRTLKEDAKVRGSEFFYKGDVIPGETKFTQVADEVAKDILNKLAEGKQVEDFDGVIYRFTNEADWNDDNIASEWATLCGERMLVIEKGDHFMLVYDNMMSLSEVIEFRMNEKMADKTPEDAKSAYLKSEKKEPAKPEGQVAGGEVKTDVSDAMKAIQEAKKLRELQIKPTETQKQIAGEGVGGTKAGVENGTEKNPYVDADEAYGDTNPTALLIWFPQELKRRLNDLGTKVAMTSDSWNEFGQKEQGKIYTSSYKLLPKGGSVMECDISVIDCDDHWEIEYELAFATGDLVQITNKTGDNILKYDKDKLRAGLSAVASLCREACKKQTLGTGTQNEPAPSRLPEEAGKKDCNESRIIRLTKALARVCESNQLKIMGELDKID